MQTLEEALPILFLHCKQSSLRPSVRPFLFKTVAPPQSSNNIPPNTNTKPNPFFLPPSLPPQHKASSKTAIFGYYSTHPTTTTTTTKVITNTNNTSNNNTNKQTNKQTITTPTTPTTIPSPHYNCNLLPLLKIKCRQPPKCDGGIFEFLKKKNASHNPKPFYKAQNHHLLLLFLLVTRLLNCLLQWRKFFWKIFFFGDFFSFFGWKEKKNFFFFLQSHKGGDPTFLSFGRERKEKKENLWLEIFFFDFFNQILGTPWPPLLLSSPHPK